MDSRKINKKINLAKMNKFKLNIALYKIPFMLQNLRYAKELRSAKKSKGETPEEVSDVK